jgi:hypothetical protein
VHAQTIMRKGVANGVITFPPRGFEVPSELYYKNKEIENASLVKLPMA